MGGNRGGERGRVGRGWGRVITDERKGGSFNPTFPGSAHGWSRSCGIAPFSGLTFLTGLLHPSCPSPCAEH